ncbi:HNH endonuclease [Candidatus Protofrankia californiensis]|uniref:HNH endonuclease n=1 Tax=Candidatus Protofrankia californiensis TaxID=1839754 RepID=A0A1C3PC16_9ACTN|nr:HNH endonuclease [Candidatus Protofrankia californiensis]
MFDIDVEHAPLHQLEAELCAWAGRISAAMCAWLLTLAAFDRREGWTGVGIRSCAHWLSWKCGISLRTGYEHLRVGHALEQLPALRDAFANGRLSYAKVRAISRVADAGSEVEWVRQAVHTTAGQLDRLVAAYSRLRGSEGLDQAVDRHARRSCTWRWDDDGSLVVHARLTPEDGALFVKALDAAHTGRTEGAGRTEGEDDSEGKTRTPRDRAANADALTTVAGSFLGSAAPTLTDPARYAVNVHIDASLLTNGAQLPNGTQLEQTRSTVEPGIAVHCETIRRLACDATVTIPNAGRRRRTVPQALRRLLQARDRGTCQYPGCDHIRWLHAHHATHWADGGRTDLDNLVLLCSFHHHAVHEAGFTLTVSPDHTITVRRPDGTAIPRQHPTSAGTEPLVRLRNATASIDHGAITAQWAGEPLLLQDSITALLDAGATRQDMRGRPGRSPGPRGPRQRASGPASRLR